MHVHMRDNLPFVKSMYGRSNVLPYIDDGCLYCEMPLSSYRWDAIDIAQVATKCISTNFKV